jgi:hypothetical protein
LICVPMSPGYHGALFPHFRTAHAPGGFPSVSRSARPNLEGVFRIYRAPCAQQLHKVCQVLPPERLGRLQRGMPDLRLGECRIAHHANDALDRQPSGLNFSRSVSSPATGYISATPAIAIHGRRGGSFSSNSNRSLRMPLVAGKAGSR